MAGFAAERRRFPTRAVTLLIGLILVADAAAIVIAGCYVPWKILCIVPIATLVLGVAVIAVALFRYGGDVAAKLDEDENLDDRLAGKLLLILAGVLLILPGFLTDILGLALLLPQSRRYLLGAMKHFFLRSPPFPPLRFSPDAGLAVEGNAVVPISGTMPQSRPRSRNAA
jgi:UPF0716 family protein affecting phage T7 exclusion